MSAGAEQVEQPGARLVDGEHEGQRQNGADEVARDHDALAVEAVESHAGDGAGQHGGDGAREHDAAHHQPRAAFFHDQGEDGDVVEVVADFAHHLAHPGVAVVAVLAQQIQKRRHDNSVTPLANRLRSLISSIHKERRSMTGSNETQCATHSRRFSHRHAVPGGRGNTQADRFFEAAFGAQELGSHGAPGRRGMHAEVKIGDSKVMMGEADGRVESEALLAVPVRGGRGCRLPARDPGGRDLGEGTVGPVLWGPHRGRHRPVRQLLGDRDPCRRRVARGDGQALRGHDAASSRRT